MIGNLIDKLCRNSQDGQTIGLPVGPDTSRMIAELVGSAMWLYSYESTLKGINGSGVGDGFVKSHRYFGKLYEKKIDFYRSGLGIGKINEMLQKRKRENATSHRLALDFDEDHAFNIDELEDFDDFDDIDDAY